MSLLGIFLTAYLSDHIFLGFTLVQFSLIPIYKSKGSLREISFSVTLFLIKISCIIDFVKTNVHPSLYENDLSLVILVNV